MRTLIAVFAACAVAVHAFTHPIKQEFYSRTSVTTMVKRPQLKGAKKANRLRPRKSRLSDIYRKPPAYNVEPQYYDGRPDEYTVLSEGDDNFDKNAHVKTILARLETEEPYDNTDPEEEARIVAAVKYPDPAFAEAAALRRA